MEAPLAMDRSTVAGAVNLNLNDDQPRRPRLTLPPITVYSSLILRQLMLISIFTILFNMVQLVCQACLLIRSKRIVISLLNSFAVCWTFLLVVMTVQWLMILKRNQMEIMKKGKMIVAGCQLLSVLNLISTFMALCLEAVEDSNSAWKLTLFKGLPYFPSHTINDDIRWLMGSMIGCNCLNIALFVIIIYYIRKGRAHIHQIISAWLWRAIYQHIMINPAQLNADSLNGNAMVRDYILATFNRDPSELLSKDLEYSAPAA